MGEAEFEHVAALGEHARDGIHDTDGLREADCHPGQMRGTIGSMLKGFLQVAAGDQRGLNVEQGTRVKHTAPGCQIHGRADVVRTADCQVIRR